MNNPGYATQMDKNEAFEIISNTIIEDINSISEVPIESNIELNKDTIMYDEVSDIQKKAIKIPNAQYMPSSTDSQIKVISNSGTKVQPEQTESATLNERTAIPLTPNYTVTDFKALQLKEWEMRPRQFNTHVRVALLQWECGESYSHPIDEACSASPHLVELHKNMCLANYEKPLGIFHNTLKYLPSCNEYRRQQILKEAINACKAFGVDVLVLPEYSTRPDTIVWLQGQLAYSNISVWAGTHRIPADHTALLSSNNNGIAIKPWSSILSVLIYDQNDPSNPMCYRRAKRYPSIAFNESFYPQENSDLLPVFQQPVKGFDPRSFITELICAEMFFACSLANTNTLLRMRERLLRKFNVKPPSGESYKDWVKRQVKDDFDNLSAYLGYDINRQLWPRRSIILVPAMTRRCQDFVLFGQSGLLAAGLAMVFCNAIHPDAACGCSCIIGAGSWDNIRGRGASSSKDSPYHGVYPGLYNQSIEDRGWLGENEQALLIADIDPIYMAGGNPQPETLPAPIQLVAHLPIIESHISKVKTKERIPLCLCKSREWDSNIDVQKYVLDIFNHILPIQSNRTTVDDPDSLVTLKLLNELSGYAKHSAWLGKRANAYSSFYLSDPIVWPPPALIDWLYVDIAKIANNELDKYPDIEVPAYTANQ